MNCRDAQFYLRLRHPASDELGPEVTADLDRHLAGCPDCASEGLIQAGFDAAVAGAMRAVEIPTGLRTRLVANLSSQRGTELRRKVYRSLALAASLFLTVGIAFGAYSAARPKLDTDSLVRATDFQVQNPEEATRVWLAGQELPPRLPLPFDFGLLVGFGFESIQNRDVPTVTFRERDGAGFAKVHIFKKRGAFDLKGVQDAVASHGRADVIDDQGVVYVVVYTGHKLDPFLRAGGNGVAMAR